MAPRSRLRRALVLALALVVLTQLACGTLLYPERHGRRSGRVDPGVIVMDGVLLLFFVVPGLVAFAVDFYTGSIYVRRGDHRAVLHLEPHERTPAGVEAKLSAELRREIRLDDYASRRIRLPRDESPFEALDRV